MRFRGMLLHACMLLVLSCAPRAHAQELLVSAAASLTNALQDVGAAFQRAHPGVSLKFNFASSGALQQQIEQGAPVDVFFSAAPKQMDALQQKHLIDTTTRKNIVTDELVLIAPKGATLRGWQDLASPSVQRIAISDPASVPSGEYARETLTSLGLWVQLFPKYVLGENVRQTLAYVENGDVDAGVVFEPDALIAKRSVIVARAPAGSHQPIVYSAAVVAASRRRGVAATFVEFLLSAQAQQILLRYGFHPIR